MKVDIFIHNENDIYEVDASISLGWFEITSEETVIYFFKQRLCMVFLTLNRLMEYLRNAAQRNKDFQWVGEDNGYFYRLNLKKDRLEISFEEFVINVDFEKFKRAIIKSVDSFLEITRSKNVSIINESAYIDLQESFRMLNEGQSNNL